MSSESIPGIGDKTVQLLRKGVIIPAPQTVDVGEDVLAERISGEGVILYPGTRIFGSRTYIAPGVRIGQEGPVTIDNCYIGPAAALKGGYFRDAVFLAEVTCGSGAHVREGTIMEEKSSIAHTVGLKQTILFPYVTLGSLINFCDCLMSGGTDAGNHSEVGSSYIHFNFSANQDKATASLIGDVPRGVMLNQQPIFLGGQGGLVGPSRVTFGTVLAAGSICRKDQLKPNQLVFEATAGRGSLPFSPGSFRNIKKILFNNLFFIANLSALHQWYNRIRSLFVGENFPSLLLEGLQAALNAGLKERYYQLDRLRDKILAVGAAGTLQLVFCERWPEIKGIFMDTESSMGRIDLLSSFSSIIEKQIQEHGRLYLTAIKRLSISQSNTGTQWLDSIVEDFMDRMKSELSILR